MTSTYALYALETLLDKPQHLSRNGGGARAELRATWSCGCVATGQTTTSLELVPCAAHAKLFEV
ncbi:MAG TPA: hypothetical protein VGD01_05310 [Candidatus Elarobacter sp.]|jgi:hypothetical protein